MKAFITGITGQDGSYLAEHLLEKNYEVFGFLRRTSTGNCKNIGHIKGLTLLQGDMTDPQSIETAVSFAKPDEVYNLAAHTFVPTSWMLPTHTFSVNTLGFLALIEATFKVNPNARLFQASTSEMYGNSRPVFSPESPYAISKLAAHHLARDYRKKYGYYIATAIMFNHESPRRGGEFVTQKVINYVKGPKDKPLVLGNLDVSRDWGYAKEYVEAMPIILSQSIPNDYEIATSKSHTIRELLLEAFGGNDYLKYVQVNPALKRKNEVYHLKGRTTVPGWRPKTTFKELIRIMLK